MTGGPNDLERHHVLQVLVDEGLIQVRHILPARRLGRLLAHLGRIKPAAVAVSLALLPTILSASLEQTDFSSLNGAAHINITDTVVPSICHPEFA